MNNKTLTMIRKYCDNEDLLDDDDEDYTKPSYNTSNEPSQSYPSIFTNPLLKTSFALFSILKRIIIRKENLTLIHYVFKWRTLSSSSSIEHNQPSTTTTAVNRNLIEKMLNDPIPSHEDYDQSEIYQDNNAINDDNEDEDYIEEDLYKTKERIIAYSNTNTTNPPRREENYAKGITLLNSIVNTRLRLLYEVFHSRSYLTITRKKLSTSQLTLLYIFTELAICKTKEAKMKGKGIQSQPQSQPQLTENPTQHLKDKIYELEKLNKKYENILDEKSQIIIRKNDEIESLNEKIEDLAKNASKNKKENFNVIQESLCSKCGNSLEESFISESVSESKRVIHEQLIYIERMQKEINDLKLKNNSNEIKLKDLDEIKREFKILTETFQKDKNDDGVQTETIPVGNTIGQSNSKIPPKKNRPKTSIGSSNKKKGGNVNIININTTGFNGSTSTMSNNNTNTNDTSAFTPQEIKEQIQALRYDNSILSTELLTLNKEVNRFKAENKILSEKLGKWDKERTDLQSKLKIKSDNYDKTKKENDDLIALIQSSKTKNLMVLETENKKLKNDITALQQENDSIKKTQMKYDKRINEQDSQIDKMKKMLETFAGFKAQKENMILETTKMQSEIKRLRYDLEEAKNQIDNQSIIINNKESEVAKLTEDVTYYSFNAKKSKQEAERSVQDAIAYQKIVRKMEKDLAEAQKRLIP